MSKPDGQVVGQGGPQASLRPLPSPASLLAPQGTQMRKGSRDSAQPLMQMCKEGIKTP